VGGGQANSQQAAAANTAATQSAASSKALSDAALKQGQALQPQADEYGAERQQLYNTLWGSPAAPVAPGGGSTTAAPASGGALTGFLDPNSLNVTAPTGPYAQMYTRANEQSALDTQNALQAARQAAITSGFAQGSGAQNDAELQAQLAGAQQRGVNFGNATTASYQDALSNFWNAVQAAQGQQSASQQGQQATEQQQATDTGQAVNANQGASQTYAQLYGTAGAYHPSPVGSIVGSALGAGGALGSAALTGGTSAAASCVCAGTPILMDDGSARPVEELKPGDQVRSKDGRADEIISIEPTDDVPCFLVATTGRNFVRASASHTLERPAGGYILVSECLGAQINTTSGPQIVNELSGIGKRTVYRVRLKFAHIYSASNFWSLE
jgi:hypothetical protein